MPELTIHRGSVTARVSFSGTPVLDEALQAAGFALPHPCGGRGACGKCAVRLTGHVSPPNEAERRAGTRLSCQAVLLGDADVTLPEAHGNARIETSTADLTAPLRPLPGSTGAAVDIGTTTIALRHYDLSTGSCTGTAAALNPQASVAADVMGRIDAALNGRLPLLRGQVTDAVQQLLAASGTPAPDALVVTGNTTMLYLLTGRSPDSLARAPFEADTLFGATVPLFGVQAYLPPCMNAFVGADITCAVLASGICERDETALLCDIGTNGEMALWKDGTLYVTSTAAGPAFEGAGISCGCGSVPGAIDRVTLVNGQLLSHTIDGAPAVGVCGSGLIDAIAAGLTAELIDETGAMDDDELPLAPGVALQPRDVRAVQLAKAAIAAGMLTLLETADASLADVTSLCIAGGFGSHLNVRSAATIGLIPPELTDRVRVLGNAALSGAAQTLLDRTCVPALERIAAHSRHVALGGNPRFNEHYIDQMLFGQEE